ncbi:MAG: immunity 22 family protein [Janthinobacterium lividum]
MSPTNPMSKIHVWLGMSSKSEEEFSRYFEINQADKEAGIGASQFDKDIHIKWYDDDLIGVYYSTSDDLAAALDELPTSPPSIQAISDKCAALDITHANALFYYEDADLRVVDSTKKYNELTYLGIFDN